MTNPAHKIHPDFRCPACKDREIRYDAKLRAWACISELCGWWQNAMVA